MSYLLRSKQVSPQPNVVIGQMVILLYILDASSSNLGPGTFQPNRDLLFSFFYFLLLFYFQSLDECLKWGHCQFRWNAFQYIIHIILCSRQASVRAPRCILCNVYTPNIVVNVCTPNIVINVCTPNIVINVYTPNIVISVYTPNIVINIYIC